MKFPSSSFSRLLFSLLLISAISLTTGCSQQSSGEVNIAGSSTVYPIATAMAEEFRKQHPNIDISVSSTGTGGGFSNFFCTGKTDLNNASRPIQSAELKQCRKNDIDPLKLRVATDALTVVINNKNDWAKCMTPEQLKKIWGPEDPARTWDDVNPNWPNREMELYGAASTSGTFDYFTETIVGEQGAHRSDYSATEHDNTIIQGVAGSKYAMGYFGFAYFQKNSEKIQTVAINNGNGCVKPSLETAKSGAYKPLVRPLFTYTKRSSLKNKPPVRKFVKFFVKNSARSIVSQVGYVPVKRSTMSKNLDKISSIK